MGKAFEKQIKTIEDHGEKKQIGALKGLDLKTKAIIGKSHDNPAISKENYDKL